MDQDGGRLSAEPVSGFGADVGRRLLRGGDLQPIAPGTTEGGGMKSRREPGEIPGASGHRAKPRTNGLTSGWSWDSRHHRSHAEF